MKVCVIGSGGREHALLWKLHRSDRSTEMFALPGNGGTSLIATNVSCDVSNVIALRGAVRSVSPDLVIVGPEVPLAAGISDRLAEDHIPCFGPSKNAARLESSKVFAKELMSRSGIPTADFKVFEDFHSLESYVQSEPFENGWVVKADGLAAGKGAVVCSTLDEVLSAARQMLVEQIFGDAGRRVVLERKLLGREASALFFCDGNSFLALPPAQDYKRADDGDAGPNTGGMGSYCPAGHLDDALQEEIAHTIVLPTLKSMSEIGAPFVGTLYVGLMLTDDGPQVIEYNCRFGDPETQVILPVWNGDLISVMDLCIVGRLNSYSTNPNRESLSAVSVVLAAEGYPEHYEKNIPLKEVNDTEDSFTLHAGTVRKDGKLFSNGGRVLNAVGIGESVESARTQAFHLAERLCVSGLRYRKDIAVNLSAAVS